MNVAPIKQAYSGSGFPKEAVFNQLEKILNDPIFLHSGILKRFLQFIVEETINGNANQLKEYTIALEVLGKPSDFNPQVNGIIRIHAGRLRRSLEQYYNGPGFNDALRISIPKGNYIPVFTDCSDKEFPARSCIDSNRQPAGSNDLTVAVMPFIHAYGNTLTDSFADGIGLQLSSALTGIEHCAIVAYYSMRNVSEQFSDIKTISNIVGADYIITGDIQSNAEYMRIYVQVIDSGNNQLTWSKMYQRRLTNKNIFDVQDEIAKEVKIELEQIACSKVNGTAPSTLVAVA